MSFRPLFLAVPTAIVAAAGLAWLTSATAFDGGSESVPQIAQAAPPATSPPTDANKRPDHVFSPRRMCQEMTARRIGNRAYLKSRLELKPEQIAAWDTFEKAADTASAKDKARCATLPTELKARPNFADRFVMREEFMKARVDALEAVKPSLLALYAALTPEQKVIMDSPMDGHGHGRHGRG